MEEEKSHVDYQKEKPDEEKHHHTPKHHTPSKKRGLSKDGYQKIFIALGTVLIIIVIFNLVQIGAIGNFVEERMAEAKEAAKPAELELVTITAANCKNCQEITSLVESIKNANTKILSENNLDFSSEGAQELVSKYGLEMIPTLLLFGEIDKFNAKELEKRKDALVFTKIKPPYVNPVTGKEVGKVSAILLEDSSCTECRDLNNIFDQLKQKNIFLEKEEVLEISMPRAKELINQLEIKKVPAFLISKDIDVYPFAQDLRGSEVLEKEGYYLVESPAPYFDLETNKVRGILALTMITDNLCEDCYDVNLHQNIFASMGLSIKEENTVDINSVGGAKLKIKYQLEKVPTVILTGDLEAYKGLGAFWTERMGTVENDGAYIFRNLEAMGAPFHDLSESSTTSLS